MSNRTAVSALLVVLPVGGMGRGQDESIEGAEKRSPTAKAVNFFERKVAPLLERRCYACHSHESGKAGGLVLDSRQGWEKGGNEGAAVVPGDPENSLLMSAVRYESHEMPPNEQLPADEIALLEKWIVMGAPYPRESKVRDVDPAKLWALQPISRPAVPQITDATWPRDALDAFVLRRLEEQGIQPAKDADRDALLRRITFDLTGLPPTPEQIRTFVNDESDRAYQRLVD